jgi:hypothetical protein
MGCLQFQHSRLKKVFSLHAPLLECLNDTVFEWLSYHIAQADAVTVSTPAFKDVAIQRRFPGNRISVVQPLVDPGFQTEFRENIACTSFPTIPEGVCWYPAYRESM